MINAGVVGLGSMGRNHARVFAQMQQVNLAAVADVDEETGNQIARTYKASAYTDYRRMLETERLDIVCVAVPTRLHLEVTLEAIAHGAHVLVEKPLAFSVAECQQMIDAAATRKVQLAVGHIERFNPAILELKRRLRTEELGRVFQIRSRRVGPFPNRIADVGVVFDLATHELNIMEYLIGAPIQSLYAETEREIHARHEDLLSGLLRFANGAVGVLDINWLTPTKIRELYVTGEQGMFRVDYLTQDLYFYENATAHGPDWDTLRVLRGVSEGQMIRYVVPKKEPLRAEQEAFLAAVRGDVPVAVTGLDGLKALELAQAVMTSGSEHRPVP
jgi:predicted dehydrogenase